MSCAPQDEPAVPVVEEAIGVVFECGSVLVSGVAVVLLVVLTVEVDSPCDVDVMIGCVALAVEDTPADVEDAAGADADEAGVAVEAADAAGVAAEDVEGAGARR